MDSITSISGELSSKMYIDQIWLRYVRFAISWSILFDPGCWIWPLEYGRGPKKLLIKINCELGNDYSLKAHKNPAHQSTFLANENYGTFNWKMNLQQEDKIRLATFTYFRVILNLPFIMWICQWHVRKD